MRPRITISMLSVSILSFNAAIAQDSVNDIENDQKNWARVRAELNANLEAVSDKVSLTAAAIGNSFSAELGGQTNVENVQDLGFRPTGETFFDRQVTADIELHASNQIGSVKATAAAIGNSATITANDPEGGASRLNRVTSAQYDYTSGAQANLSATISGSEETVELTSAAINNSLSVDVIGNARVSNTQSSARHSDTLAETSLIASNTVGAIAGTTAAMGNSASITFDNEFETGSSGSTLLRNNQIIRGGSNITANLKVDGADLDGADDVALETTAAAIANSLAVEGEGDLTARNLQRLNGNVAATTELDLEDVTGDVTATTAAIGNTASFDIENGGSVDISNRQWASYDPTAITIAEFDDVDGNIDLTSAAITNSLSVATLPSTAVLDVDTQQYNGALTRASVHTEIGHVSGNVSLTAAAIGNSVNIENLPH